MDRGTDGVLSARIQIEKWMTEGGKMENSVDMLLTDLPIG